MDVHNAVNRELLTVKWRAVTFESYCAFRTAIVFKGKKDNHESAELRKTRKEKMSFSVVLYAVGLGKSTCLPDIFVFYFPSE
jgi:hypothetical protein